MNRKEAVRFVVVRSLGNFLLLLSLYGVGVTFGPALYYELQYRVIEVREVKFQVQSLKCKDQTCDGYERYEIPRLPLVARNDKKNPSFLDVLAGAKEQVLMPIDTDFGILIPKIGANAKVYPNVDPANKAGFLPILQEGIAHARGTVFPGMQGNIYLFAHSTDNWWNAGRYNAVFYLLKDLVPGDEIVVFFERVRYDYVVTDKFVTSDTYVDLLSGKQTGQQRLILQTCWPPGTSWKRLYVLAKPKISI
jgi:sortase A